MVKFKTCENCRTEDAWTMRYEGKLLVCHICYQKLYSKKRSEKAKQERELARL